MIKQGVEMFDVHSLLLMILTSLLFIKYVKDLIEDGLPLRKYFFQSLLKLITVVVFFLCLQIPLFTRDHRYLIGFISVLMAG